MAVPNEIQTKSQDHVPVLLKKIGQILTYLDANSLSKLDEVITAIGAGSGGTQYDEDTASAAGEKLTMAGVVRSDTPSSKVDTDGDRTELLVDSSGRLHAASVITDGSLVASVRDTGPNDSLNVAITDAAGNQVTSFGGGTQYDEDTASAPADKLTMAGVVRKDTAATLVDADGDRTQLQVDAAGRLHTNGSGVTQPISAASLPLPTGAATEATLFAVGSIVATEATLSALNAKVTAVNTGAVVVASSALPTGAATEATLATRASEATLSSLNGKVTAVDTGNVTVVSSVLPTGAATEATLSALNAKVTACNTGAVTISAALPAGTNNIGDVDVLSLPAIPSGTNNIGDVDVLTLPATTQQTNNGKTVNRFVLAQGAAGTTQIAAADASNKHKIVGILLTMSATGTVKFLDSSGDLTGVMNILTGGGFVIPPNATFPFLETGAINRSLSITTTVGAATGVILYITEP